jgi:alpha-beta hydrolase superfamily lysophospholipase
MAGHKKIMKRRAIILTLVLMAILALFAYQLLHSDRPPFTSTIIRDLIGKEDQSVRWFNKNRLRKLRGVALVVHGLNLKPEKMGAIIATLNQEGIDVLNLSLHGHGSNYSSPGRKDPDEQRLASFKQVTYEQWFDEVLRAYGTVRQRGEQKNVPVFFVGYSLGGLLGCDLLASRPDVRFDRMVLFAPALNVTNKSFFLKVLAPFPDLVIMSLSPKNYRSNDGTPMAAYQALFQAIEHFESHLPARLNVPTVVFIDEQDESISYPRMQEMIDHQKLDQWIIHKVQKDNGFDAGIPNHLIIDRESTGSHMWEHMQKIMCKHLQVP